jgi:tRNA threonylcarbamoyladenosine biosynthesis protein TsaB
MYRTHMKILAFDTSTNISSIAIADELGIIGEYNLTHKMDLSQRMMPNILALLKDCKLSMKDLDAVAVSLGPGSFTGLRIGVVTAKTLAQALNVHVTGTVSLDVLALQFDYLPRKLICPIIKVKKGEVYYAFYRTHMGQMERISEYQADPVEKLIEYAGQIEGGEIIFCGDALSANMSALQEGLGDRFIPAPAWLRYPKASVLALEGLRKIAAGSADDPLSLVPFYIRKSTPEILLEAREKESLG